MRSGLISKHKIINFLSIFLIVTYPVDQLYTTIFPESNLFSPFKFLMAFYVFIQLKNNGLKHIFIVKKILIVLLLLIIWSFLSMYWAKEDYMFALIYSLKMFILWSFAIVVIKDFSKNENTIKSIVFYWVLISAIVAIFSLLGYFSNATVEANHRLSFGGIGLNAIAISMGYAFSIGLASFYMFKNNGLKKIIIAVSLGLIFLLIIRLGTRSVIWGVFIAFIIANLFFLKTKNLFRLGAISLLLVFSFSYLLNTGFIQGRVADRVSVFNINAILNNTRVELFSRGFEWYSDNIMGSGAGNERYAYIEIGTENLESHNTFLSALIQLGVPGFVLFIAAILLLFKKRKLIQDKKTRILFLSVFIFFIFQIAKGSVMQTRLFWQPIIFLLILVEAQRYKTSQNIVF